MPTIKHQGTYCLITSEKDDGKSAAILTNIILAACYFYIIQRLS